MKGIKHVYEVRPRKDHRGADLISDALPFGRLWYGEVRCGEQRNRLRQVCSRSRDAMIRVYDEAGNITETYERVGDLKDM